MITFHHSFSTRIFLDKTTSAEREARRAQAAAALARAKEEPRTPNELREFWWFLHSGAGVKKSLEGRALHSTGPGARVSREAARPRPGRSPTLHPKG